MFERLIDTIDERHFLADHCLMAVGSSRTRTGRRAWTTPVSPFIPKEEEVRKQTKLDRTGPADCKACRRSRETI